MDHHRLTEGLNHNHNRKSTNPKGHKPDPDSVEKPHSYLDEIKRPDLDKLKKQQLNNWNKLKEMVETGDNLDDSLVQTINAGIKTNLPNEKGQISYLPRPHLLQNAEEHRRNTLQKYSSQDKPVFKNQAKELLKSKEKIKQFKHDAAHKD